MSASSSGAPSHAPNDAGVRRREGEDRAPPEHPDEVQVTTVGGRDDHHLGALRTRSQEREPERGTRPIEANDGRVAARSLDARDRDRCRAAVGQQDHRGRWRARRIREVGTPGATPEHDGEPVRGHPGVHRGDRDEHLLAGLDRFDRHERATWIRSRGVWTQTASPSGHVSTPASEVHDHRRCRGPGMRRLSSRTMPGPDTMEPLERLLNLVGLLLETPTPLTFDQIRETLDAYQGDNLDSIKRKFERDKDMLRAYGVPLEMTGTDAWDVEQGYIIRKDRYYLPDIAFTPEEITALYLAAQSGSATADGRHRRPEAAVRGRGGHSHRFRRADRSRWSPTRTRTG